VAALLLLSLVTFSCPESGDSSPAASGTDQTITDKLHSIGGYFIGNRGQVADGIRYYSRGNPSVGFRDDGVMFVLTEIQGDGSTFNGGFAELIRSPTAAIEERQVASSLAYFLRFEGADFVRPVGNERLQFNSNFFIGNDSRNWGMDVPNYREIVYHDLYEGIDLVYRHGPTGLKYEFVVHPGADERDIRTRYEGIESMDLIGKAIVVGTALGEVHDSAPLSFQGTGGEVHCHFVVIAPLTQGFDCEGREASKTLTIDPLVYSTFISGTDKDGEGWTSVTVDSDGDAYVTGDTFSVDFPVTPGAYNTTSNPAGHTDIFVAKLNPAGSTLIYSTYLGGSQDDYSRSIAVDPAGSAYVTGDTLSPDFPTSIGAYDTTLGYDDAFVTKLNPAGNALNYSTYLGGAYGDTTSSVAVDAAGNAYVTGQTVFGDFPTTAGAFDTTFNGAENDGFVTKLSPTGSSLIYSTYLGGNGDERGFAIAVDILGNAYVAGITLSSDFPVSSGAFDETPNGGRDGFVTKLDSSGSTLVYSTLLGGFMSDNVLSIAVDASGYAYLTGSSDSCCSSRAFPVTPGAFNVTGDYAGSAFVTKLNVNGSALVYSTFLGGGSWDGGFHVAVDSDGNAFVSGTTYSNDFPVTPDAVDGSCNCTEFGPSDAFVTKLNPNGTALLYSSFLGGAQGSESARGASLALGGTDNVYVAGSTCSSDFPVTPGAFDTVFKGSRSSPDVFVAKIGIGEGANTPPLISSFKASAAGEGDVVTFTVDASDADGDALTYDFDFESDGVFDVTGPNNTVTHTWGDDYAGKATVRVSDGKSSVEANTTVTVLNIVPSGTISVVSPQHEGSPMTFLANVTDPGSDDLFLTWKWGFGASDEKSTYYNNGVGPDPYPSPDINPRDITDGKTHAYGDNGAFTVTVFVQDDDSGSSGTTLTVTATPDNLPPTVTVSGGMSIDEGQSVALTAVGRDPGSDDLTFSWDWGEGSAESRIYYNNGVGPDPPNSPGGTYPFTATDTATRAYGDNGIYTITLKVTDDDGGFTTWSGQLTVINLPPAIQPFGPFTVDEGSFQSMNATATDPGSDDLTFAWSFELGPMLQTICYNDGVGPDPPQSPWGTYPFTASDSVGHTYGDNGLYVVTLTVTDDDGGSASYSTEVNVSNLPPAITPFGPFEVNEADPLSIIANAVDPGSDDLSFTWMFEYGPTVQNIHYNDGVGPDPPKSPDGVFPFSVDDLAAHTYGDNGVFKVSLRVEDDDGGVATYETTVTVLNVPPTILNAEAFMVANITLRVAGEKWHDVILRLYEEGNETGYVKVVRYPGSPDDQSTTLYNVHISMSRKFSAVAYYTPDDDPVNGQINGADPAWLIIGWENGNETTLHHTFNVMHNDTWTWRVDDIHLYAVNQIIHFAATASDPGSDDLDFSWDSGDGRTLTTVTYNNGVGPDPYPSPEVNPITASSDVSLVYSVTGKYTVILTVTDDDGGLATMSFTIQVG